MDDKTEVFQNRMRELSSELIREVLKTEKKKSESQKTPNDPRR